MHYRILDNWRIAAALLVMIFHFLSYGHAGAIAAADRLYSLLPLMDMFLMISGFLIMRRYADTLLVERGSYAKFISRRLFRFYPLYFATLSYFVLVAVVVHLGFVGSEADGRYDLAALPANLLLLQGWGFTDRLTYNYVAWTLSAEWFCYLTLPVVVLVQRRFGVLGLIALVGCAILGLELAVATGIMPFKSWLVADTWGAYRAFADFSIGGLVAAIVGLARFSLRSHALVWGIFFIMLALMWNGLSGYAALAMLAVSIFVAAVAEQNNPEGTHFLRPIDPLAMASFSIYLIHPVVASLLLGIVWRRVLEPLQLIDFYVYMLFPIGVTIALSLASVRFFEAPLSKYLNARFVASCFVR